MDWWALRVICVMPGVRPTSSETFWPWNQVLKFSVPQLSHLYNGNNNSYTAAAKSLQSCLTLCGPIDGSPPGSPVPGILQARTLEWVAISFSTAWKWKVKVKPFTCAQLFATLWTAAYQAPPSIGFSRQEYQSGVPLPSPKMSLDIAKCSPGSKISPPIPVENHWLKGVKYLDAFWNVNRSNTKGLNTSWYLSNPSDAFCPPLTLPGSWMDSERVGRGWWGDVAWSCLPWSSSMCCSPWLILAHCSWDE